MGDLGERDIGSILHEAGWTPERRVSIASDLRALREGGYHVWPALERFLEEYSGLIIPYKDKHGHLDTVWFSAQKACEWFAQGWEERYSTIVGCFMSPVGYARTNHLALLLAADGRFFGSYDYHLSVLGRGAHEVITNLISVRGEVIPTDSIKPD